MRTHLFNAAYGLLDYAAYPIGMLIVAPVILHRMGTAQYGIWTIATAVVGMGSIIASGFGDANIRHVASQRGAGNREEAVVRAVRSMIGINLMLGSALALAGWVLAPYAAPRLASSDVVLQGDCLWSLRLACFVILLRALESVCIGTQRAFERYGAAVRISILARVLSMGAAALLSCFASTVAPLVAATAVFTLLGTGLQFGRLRELLNATSLSPLFDRAALRPLLGFGAFTWLQAVSCVVFAQADRLLLGVSLGAAAVASYALCTQIAQPIHGFAASGLHFLFPYLAGRGSSQTTQELRRAVLLAFAANLAFVAAASAGLLLLGPHILFAWGGKRIADNAQFLLPIVVGGFALLGLNVTATYALFALGQVRIVTWLNLAGGAAMLLFMIFLLPRFGAQGLAMARLGYGAITLLLYFPLARRLSEPIPQSTEPICEEA